MKLNLTADEVLTTTRSVRKRLDFDKPVDRATVEECLELALQAPTGSNSQGWHWVVIEDPELRKAVCAVYQRNFQQYATMPGAQREEVGRRQRRPAVLAATGEHGAVAGGVGRRLLVGPARRHHRRPGLDGCADGAREAQHVDDHDDGHVRRQRGEPGGAPREAVREAVLLDHRDRVTSDPSAAPSTAARAWPA